MIERRSCDVAIIGGGPSGAAAGIHLARSGKQVLILEKEKFPRFCVGESLLPRGNSLLRELGVWEKVEKAGFQRKYGAEFCTGDGTKLLRFWFGANLGSEFEYTYQVERGEFDKLLLDHAAEEGCAVSEQTSVGSVRHESDGSSILECTGPEGPFEVSSRWVLDSAGRTAFAGGRMGLQRQSTQKDRRIAIYGHFEGVFRNQGKAEGHITIVRMANGWFWIIPLGARRTSVGLVLPVESTRASSGRSLEDIFNETVKATPEMRTRMHGATQVLPLHATGDYSWKFSSFAQDRLVFVGDAAGFVDPVFSSGVLLALKSAREAAALVLRADREQRPLSSRECAAYTRTVSSWMKRYSRIIGQFYDPAGFEVFMNPSPVLNIPGAIGRLVGGETDPSLIDRVRIALFHGICRLQRHWPVVGNISYIRQLPA